MINIEYDKDKDAYIVPKWLMRSMLGYDREEMSFDYKSLNDYGKGVVDTLKKQQEDFSVNIKADRNIKS